MQPRADSLGRLAVRAEVGGAAALSLSSLSQVWPAIGFGCEAVVNEVVVEGGASRVVHAINICSRRIIGRDELVVDAGELRSGRGHGGVGLGAPAFHECYGMVSDLR